MQFSLLFQVYRIFRGTSNNLIITVSVIPLWGIPVAGSHTCTFLHHWQIHLIMCEAKIITVSFEDGSEIQGSSPETGTEPTLDQETSLNSQQLK